jgi:hypothetical protein
MLNGLGLRTKVVLKAQVVLPPRSEVVRPIAIAVADVPKRIVIQFVAQCDQEPMGFSCLPDWDTYELRAN